MALQYLKIEAEKAVQLLDDNIIKGYQTKDKINSEYCEKKATITKELIDNWRTMATEWNKETIKELQKIFVSLVYAYNFRDAEISPLIIVGENRDWDSIIKYITTKITMLNQYNAEIKTHFNIQMEIVLRDKIVASGNNNVVKILND